MLEQNHLLVDILKKRTGGVANLNGISYQLNYAVLQLLYLDIPDQYVQLEGIEDVDLRFQTDSIFCQLKYAHLEKDRLTSSKLIEKNTLKNIFEVYQRGVSAKFKIIHNHNVSDSNLKPFITLQWNSQLVNFWNQQLPFLNDNAIDFLNKVTIERLSEKELDNEINKLLLSRIGTHSTSYIALKNALFVNAFNWSRQRKIVLRRDIDYIFSQHIELISSGIQNDALKYKWIQKIDFEFVTNQDVRDYFEGKAAQPVHIAQKLPVERPHWKNKIIEAVENFDVIIVKSSSGQGKSTLAWQVAEYYSKKGHSIYQIHTCQDENQVGSLLSHTETLTQILGEIPIIVIDGLSSKFKAWAELASRLFTIPSKIIITTREEDWFRFGSESHRLKQDIVEIALSYQEAGEIFSKFQKEKPNLLAPHVRTFEPAWEQVEGRNLLIEYIYYLTQGQMLETRLKEQLKTMRDDIDNKAKKEILRLVALADCCNIRLETNKLLNCIEQITGIQGDKYELLDEIEKEYAIKFSEQVIEGLHPVRSEHLLKLLFRYPSDTILQFLNLVDENELGSFFAYFPNLLPDSYNREELYQKIAVQLSSQSYTAISNALSGLYVNAVLRYWLNNKTAFDDAFQYGGFMLFMMMAVPYPPKDSMDEISNLMPEIRNIQSKVEQLPRFFIVNTELNLLCHQIFSQLPSVGTNLIGLNSVIRWLEMVHLPVQDLRSHLQIDTRKCFEANPLEQTAALLSDLGKLKIIDFEDFAIQNQKWLISLYKQQTDTPTVEISEDTSIHIEYLIEPNEVDTNNQSVRRLDLLMRLLPQFEKYTIKAVVFPFPNERIAYFSTIDSEKAFTHKTSYDDYKVRTNQLFMTQIEAKYAAQSAYEWQKYWKELRESGLNFVKIACRMLEDVLENKKSRFEADASQLDQKGDVYLQRDKQNLQAPFIQENYNLTNNKDKRYDEKPLQDWSRDLGTFIRQFSNLFSSKSDSHSKYLVLHNFRDAYQKLQIMQNSFDKNCAISRSYFTDEIVNLCPEENGWYSRLKNALEYFYENWVVKNERIPVLLAKNACKTWKQEKQQKMLSGFIEKLAEIQLESPLVLYFPNKLMDDRNYTTVAFGAMSLGEKNILEEGFWALICYLSLFFHDFELDYIIIIPVIGGIAQQNGMRVQKSLLADLKQAIDEDRTVQEIIQKHQEKPLYSNLPLPFIINPEIIETVDDLKFEEYVLDKKQKDIYSIILNLWRVSEYRKRINYKSEIESAWLKTIENELSQTYNNFNLSFLSDEIRSLIQVVIDKGKILDKQLLVDILIKNTQARI